MTTPIVNERPVAARNTEMYGGLPEVATRRGASSARTRWLHAAQGAAIGALFWMLFYLFGITWVFHIPGFDGMLPSMIVGAIVGATRLRLVALAVVLAMSVVILFVLYTPVIVGPARSLIRNDPLPQRADAIVVLAGGVNDDGLILPQALDRLLKGLDLLNRGIAPVLVLSREAYIIGGQLVTSRADHERIVSLVPGGMSKVIVSGATHSTHDEAVRAAALFRANRWKRVVVVTSPMHTRRACGTFERAGIVVSCAASESREIALRTLAVPDDRIQAFRIWVYEMAGTMRYRQLGWL